MSCFYPLWRQHRGEYFKVPCGRCMGCRLDHARMWSVRCVQEASLHKDNCFLTLTFNKESLPANGSVSKRDLQLFLKRLRKAVSPLPVRFFACGEYGEEMGRPHYHVLLFGYDFPDKKVLYVTGPAKTGRVALSDSYSIYTSEMLSSVWPFGFSTIGEVSLQSCGYTARYVRKKIGGEQAIDHYKGKTPEFCLMSRKPGIGHGWFEKYWNDLFPKDFTTIKGKRYRAPRYYDKLLMRLDWDMYEQVKAERINRTTYPDIIARMSLARHVEGATSNLLRKFERPTVKSVRELRKALEVQSGG